MAHKPLTKPRKHATQDRSRVTVDTLIAATARILVKEGFDKASTNRIAEKAGVSVGSLYQYFPSKEALVVAVIERHQLQLMQVIRRAAADITGQSIEKGLRRLVSAAIEAHRVDPKLHRVLAEQVPRTGRLEHVETFNSENFTFFRSYLESHRDEIRVANLDLAAFLCVTSIEALTHNAVLYHSEMLSDELAGMLVDETTRLVVGYLK